MFFARDPQHRALIRLEAGGSDQALVASTDRRTVTFDAQPSSGAGRCYRI